MIFQPTRKLVLGLISGFQILPMHFTVVTSKVSNFVSMSALDTVWSGLFHDSCFCCGQGKIYSQTAWETVRNDQKSRKDFPKTTNCTVDHHQGMVHPGTALQLTWALKPSNFTRDGSNTKKGKSKEAKVQEVGEQGTGSRRL